MTRTERDDDELEMVSGRDSVSLYTEVCLSNLNDIGERLVDAYSSEAYKERYPWADFIEVEGDAEVVSALDELITESINNGDYEYLWISPPSIINYEDFSGFVYQNTRKDPCFHPEMDLSVFLKETGMRIPVSVASIKKGKRINCCRDDGSIIEQWSLYEVLNGEISHEGKKYVINDGKWYKVKDTFYQAVDEYFNDMSESEIQFPPYGARHEGEYLREIADGKKLALLDQKWVVPQETGNRLEFCDLLSDCNAFIHVKKYGASSVLSHLFSQASVGVDLLFNDPTIQGQVNKHLEGTDMRVDFNHGDSPRKYRVVLAVMQKNAGPLHLPFFSKVNLRHHARRLERMGFKVEKAKISIGS